MTDQRPTTPSKTAPTTSNLDAFLAEIRKPAAATSVGRGRLLFALDAIARLTHGAYCRFNPGAAYQLAELLRAVAVFAAGGMPALAAQHNASAIKLLSQLES